jgi:hypothetical protein
MLYWAQSQQALQLGAWWWFVPPGLAVALIGTALVLLNTGIDELGNPRLRNVGSASAGAWRKLRPTDPTPVESGGGRRDEHSAAAPPSRGRLASFFHSFSRASMLDEPADGDRP